MQRLFVFFLLLTISIVAAAQENKTAEKLPVLTKKQMFADFDKMTEIIREISPQTVVRKKVTGLDALRELGKIRARIPKIKTTEEFAFLVREAVTLLQDGHSSLIRAEYLPREEMLELGISAQALDLLPAYDQIFRVLPEERNKFDLQLKYLNGEYYNVAPFKFQNQTFDSAAKLRKVNGEEVHKFVARLYPFRRMMRWDFKKRRYFSEDFFKAYNLTEKGALKLEFIDGRGKTLTGVFNLTEPLAFSRPAKAKKDPVKKVEYFADEEILYVRLPRMDLKDTEFYLAAIKEKAAGKPLKSVIIDIRDNPGGSDNVWVNVLGAIIAEPIVFENFIFANPSPMMKKHFAEESPKWKTFRAPYLDDYEYAVFASGEARIEPAADSLKYAGKIFILQNEGIYSSAGSLAAIGVLAKNVYTVGTNTGRLLGRGISPFLYELPNSKIIFRVEPVIDFLNVSKAEDVFHDTVEMPVELTIEQYLELFNYEGDVYDREFLFAKDPIFKKALENR